MAKKRKSIDRRYIFLFIFIGVSIPLIVQIGFKIEVSENVQKAYNLIDQFSPQTPVLISFDYDPASKPELHPMALAVIRHCIEKDYKIVCTALWPMGVVMCNDIFKTLHSEYPELTYGENYVNLGYKVGGKITVQRMGKNFRQVFPTDTNGTSIDELPVMDGIKNFEPFGFVFSLSAGDPGMKDWVMIARDTYQLKTTGGTTGVSVPSFLPYVNEQEQLTGLLGALKGAAEYEFLTQKPGLATSGMDAQSLAHLIIIMFIVIGNVNYYRNKKRAKKEIE
jgi:hypothetical protein